MEQFVWHGDHEFDKALDDYVTRVEKATIAGLQAGGALVVTETKTSFGGSPGPTSRSGTLAGSVIVTEPVKKGLDTYVAQVGPSGVVYARKVELGKKGHRSARPHPYLQPAWARAITKFNEAFAKSWATAAPKG